MTEQPVLGGENFVTGHYKYKYRSTLQDHLHVLYGLTVFLGVGSVAPVDIVHAHYHILIWQYWAH